MTASVTPTRAAPSLETGERSARTTLVVGLDGSDTSWSAFWWAWGEAQRLQGRLVAVYVTGAPETKLGPGAVIPGFDAGAYTEAIARVQADEARRLEGELFERTCDADVELEFRHVQGDPVDQLTRVAREARADVIAVGRSARPLHRLVGSLGRRLTRKRGAPIVVIVP